MKLEEAIKTLKEHGYINMLTHTDALQKVSISSIKRKLNPSELEEAINYLEKVSNPELGLNYITLNDAIHHVVFNKQNTVSARAFFKELRELGITEIFESEHGLNGFLIQYFKLLRPSGDMLDIIIITKTPDIFYVYHSGNAQTIPNHITEILNAKWYTTV